MVAQWILVAVAVAIFVGTLRAPKLEGRKMKVTIEVPDQHIDGALAEPHSRYWASAAQWHRDSLGGVNGFVVEREGKGGEPVHHELNKANLQQALDLLATKAPRELPKLATGMWDGCTGDVLLQLMAFGEVRYG